jgi:hypothetical protein
VWASFVRYKPGEAQRASTGTSQESLYYFGGTGSIILDGKRMPCRGDGHAVGPTVYRALGNDSERMGLYDLGAIPRKLPLGRTLQLGIFLIEKGAAGKNSFVHASEIAV